MIHSILGGVKVLMTKIGEKYKILHMLQGCSVILIVVGYFLFTMLIPLQDFGSYTTQELLELQKEVAINYSLGKTMMIAGGVGLVVNFFVYIYFTIKKLINLIKVKKKRVE